MSKSLKVLGSNWMLRSVPLLLLIIGIGLAPVAQAAAPASNNSAAAITVYAPGATLGWPVAVEYIDAAGKWVNASGWTGTLDRETDNVLVPFKEFTVFQANYGQGPFRWVVYKADGNTVWGISDNFNLPPGGGINQTETIVPGVSGNGAGAAPAPTAPAATPAPAAATPTPSAPANTSLLLTNTGNAFFHLNCSNCSAITGYFLGVPATSWIAVQWGDGLGDWMTVPTWQGMADTTDSTTGQLIKSFAFFQANFGQGPFRWAVYDRQGGTLLGYSANFNLPATNGITYFQSFSK